MKSPFTKSSHVTAHVARQVRTVRKGRGWTLQQLANRCADLGAPWLTTQVVQAIERQHGGTTSRARYTTVDDLAALAAALGVPPAALLPGAEGETPTVTLNPVGLAAIADQLQGIATQLAPKEA